MEGFPYAERRAGVPVRRGDAWTRSRPVYHDWWAHDERRGARGVRGVHRLAGRAPAAGPVAPRLPLRLLRGVRGQAAHGQVRHPRGRGGRPAARRRVRGPLQRRAAGVRRSARRATRSRTIEHLYLPPRTGPVLSAGGSVVEYQTLDRQRRAAALAGVADPRGHPRVQPGGLRVHLGAPELAAGPAAGERDRATCPIRCGAGSRRSPTAERAAAEAARGPAASSAASSSTTDAERARLDQLLGWLVEFHRREEKPMWWRMFERHDDDGRGAVRRSATASPALTRTDTPPRTIKRSARLEYSFDPGAGDQAARRRRVLRRGRQSLDLRDRRDGRGRRAGRAQGRPGASRCPTGLPDPRRVTSARTRSSGPSLRYAEAWERGEIASQAVDDLLRRRPPRIAGHAGGAARRRDRGSASQRACELVDAARRHAPSASRARPAPARPTPPPRSSSSCSGAARRIGVTAQSHKVILNLMDAVVEGARPGRASPRRSTRSAASDEDPLVQQGSRSGRIESKDVAGVLGDGAVPGRRHRVGLQPRGAGGRVRLPLHRRGRPGLARERGRRRASRPAT